ncbi:hypothetical protein [Micromonospora sp. LOL_015]|uniref:hypothetical protein n=1 Tax=Micromonospora sp. LOL_015 TaxID=3345416 RepID=UPI003A8A7406
MRELPALPESKLMTLDEDRRLFGVAVVVDRATLPWDGCHRDVEARSALACLRRLW